MRGAENFQGQDLWLFTWREKDEQIIISYLTYAVLLKARHIFRYLPYISPSVAARRRIQVSSSFQRHQFRVKTALESENLRKVCFISSLGRLYSLAA